MEGKDAVRGSETVGLVTQEALHTVLIGAHSVLPPIPTLAMLTTAAAALPPVSPRKKPSPSDHESSSGSCGGI